MILPSENKEDDHRTATKIFEDACPFFMAWGMTWEQFWDGDNELPRIYYRKHRIEQQEKNRDMHRLGAYIYETLCRLMPFSVGLIADEKIQRRPYIDEPLPMTEQEAKEQEDRRKIAEFEAFRASMLAYAAANNLKYEQQKKGG